MKKAVLMLIVLAAWFLVKNPEYTQLLNGNKAALSGKALVAVKTAKQYIFPFTTVHLPEVKIQTNNSKHTTQSCLWQATNDKHLHNHEPLLIVNGL